MAAWHEYALYLLRYAFWLALCTVTSLQSGQPLPSAATAGPVVLTRGEIASFVATEQMGKPYALGQPARGEEAARYQPTALDCSGLVWWVAEQLGIENMPSASQEQWGYGVPLAGTLWDNNLPVGALVFLADPAAGPGATHVSIFLGNGVVADCYTPEAGCLAHNAASDPYYRAHWLGARYPWGDQPVLRATPR